MIQRIQSIYLLLAAIVSGLSAFLPIWKTSELAVSLSDVTRTTNTGAVMWLGFITMGAIYLMEMLAIFQFKKRKRQMLLCRISLVLSLFILGLMVMVYFFNETIVHFSYGGAIFMLSIILNIMAMRAIAKDEALIRSLDRIR